MQVAWLTSCKTDEERTNFKEQVLSSKKVLDKLYDILYNRVYTGEVFRAEEYDSPSWSHKQADRNGYLRAMREVMELLKVSDRET